MARNKKTFMTVVIEDGTHAVVRTSPNEPYILEVVAIFYDAARARRYADIENSQEAGLPLKPSPPARAEPTPVAEDDAIEPDGAVPELTQRQSDVLETLRAKAGSDNVVAMKGADLAEAANIPLGSVHSVLQSLEKKKRIVSTRPGVFQIL
jgi:hypothetical protein